MMKKPYWQNTNGLNWLTVLALAAAMGIVGLTDASASEPSKHRGYVDGSVFAELAEDDDRLIEVTIRGPLLKIASKAIAIEDEALGEFLDQIVSINAVIVETDKDVDRVARLIREITERLEDRDWERLARIREDDTNITVYVLYDDEVIDGITVFVSEGDEIVFANIAGRIDLALIGNLGSKLHIPGLKALAGGDWAAKKAKKMKRRHRSKE